MSYLDFLTVGGRVLLGDDPALDLSGDAEWRFDLSLDDWTPVSPVFIADRWNAATQRSWEVKVASDGSIELWLEDGAGAFRLTSTLAWAVAADGTRIQLRIRLDADDGAGNTVVTLDTRQGANIADLETDTNWTLEDTNTHVGLQTWVASAEPIALHGQTTVVDEGFLGRLYGAIHWSDLTKTIKVFDVDFTLPSNRVGGFNSVWDDEARTGNWVLDGVESIDWLYVIEWVAPDVSFATLLGDREFLSQYGIKDVGFVLHVQGVPADADGDVTVQMETLADPPQVIFPYRVADHPAVGVYETTLSSAETNTPGIYKLTHLYEIAGKSEGFVSLIEVGESSPAYDALDDEFKALVESVWIRFADLFDHPFGGPHLQVYFQTRFGRGRMAQLLSIALGKLNTVSQPTMTYTLGPEKKFPLGKWGSVLESGAYIECIKHLIRSYVEQPQAQAVNVARLERRDYMDRWAIILRMEEDEFKSQLEIFKMSHMGLGRGRALVAGGAYGTYAPTRLPVSAAARPRYWSRFY